MDKKNFEKWKKIWKNMAEKENRITQTGRNINEAEFELIVKDIKEKLEIKSDDKVIDVGCASGKVTFMISQEVKEVAGIDFSNELLSQAKRNSNIHYYLANSTKLPFKEESLFDKGLFYSVAHYLPKEDLLSTLKELSRVCKPGALIFVGDVPDADKKQNHPNPRWTYYKKEDFKEMCESIGLEANIIEQSENLPYSHYRYDVVIINTKNK